MKILIDEQLPVKLKSRFLEMSFTIFTVRDMHWLGTKNGNLLELMRVNDFSVLLTNDKNLYYQQKISSLKVCVVNINCKTNRYDDVLEIIDSIRRRLNEVEIHLNNNPGGYFIV
jgi:predicted nuclease of predicted toxin-antitoxin system